MLDGNVFTSIFFGFGASMLGITGFESSSNYVEEQPGVFRKTLRNMWALVTFFNLGLGVGILAVLPLDGDDGIYASSDALLAKVARVAVGSWFETWACIDAFIVLSGAVLTSYVGICGLVERLSNDRVLPAFLAKKNKLRGTSHNIIGLYFLLSASRSASPHRRVCSPVMRNVGRAGGAQTCQLREHFGNTMLHSRIAGKL
ncbi:hypothetical protein PF005_g1826 [Phytophthora fragariae]|uniref:Amino acid permease/ SLC12A domain-containing protein n=1 Tax=Phytophthora fragariae TaxID=53985 RepID=A0A6A3QC20_9STRA|nr:hypothetical protein PF003_g13745 [Phytophthora fragariae]KAE8922872.1 hypothetical protein PF009_g26868 [Phytophthora fragariae]KAE8974507.1 hypothetical protein PF011_g24836 [Phytophthora fragariae]KAE9073220.1 hypothetical protein PF007_g25883 [Phytophthora fragariae]KAE9077710.1 hypothetical protein PF010_g23409 [Phytophthora fragariae]